MQHLERQDLHLRGQDFRCVQLALVSCRCTPADCSLNLVLPESNCRLAQFGNLPWLLFLLSLHYFIDPWRPEHARRLDIVTTTIFAFRVLNRLEKPDTVVINNQWLRHAQSFRPSGDVVATLLFLDIERLFGVARWRTVQVHGLVGVDQVCLWRAR